MRGRTVIGVLDDCGKGTLFRVVTEWREVVAGIAEVRLDVEPAFTVVEVRLDVAPALTVVEVRLDVVADLAVVEG